jgi:hypothetical protein
MSVSTGFIQVAILDTREISQSLGKKPPGYKIHIRGGGLL